MTEPRLNDSHENDDAVPAWLRKRIAYQETLDLAASLALNAAREDVARAVVKMDSERQKLNMLNDMAADAIAEAHATGSAGAGPQDGTPPETAEGRQRRDVQGLIVAAISASPTGVPSTEIIKYLTERVEGTIPSQISKALAALREKGRLTFEDDHYRAPSNVAAAAASVQPGDVRDRLLASLKSRIRPVAVGALAVELDIEVEVAAEALDRLVTEGIAYSPSIGLFDLVPQAAE